MNSAHGYSEGSEIADAYNIPNKPLSAYESATFNMENPLIQEKEEIERKIKSFEESIELAKTAIYWQKKRLRLVEQELDSNTKQAKNPKEINNDQDGNSSDQQ